MTRPYQPVDRFKRRVVVIGLALLFSLGFLLAVTGSWLAPVVAVSIVVVGVVVMLGLAGLACLTLRYIGRFFLYITRSWS